MGLLEGLLAGAINGAIAAGIRSLREADERQANEYESCENDYNIQWNDIRHAIPGIVTDRCKELSGDANRLEKYLNACVNERLVKRKYVSAIMREFVSDPAWQEKEAKRIETAKLNKPEKKEQETEQRMSSNKPSPNKVTLANTLKGVAPDAILQHCDSISDKKILLETYLMQCQNQGKISQQTATLLLEKYTQRMDECTANEASREKLKKQTEQAAKAAGLSLYAYVKNQLHESVRTTIEEKKDDLESMERYLRVCLEQKLISEYYYDVILEESKGHCALRRLQATGGQRWEPLNILRGLAPENILNHCDKDANAYGMQIVYLDQQVLQGNVTRQTADLILNIYKLAREQ